MISAILSLVGGGLGALMRLAPSVLKMFSDKSDREHEFRMTQLQLEIDKERATQQLDLIHAGTALESMRGEMAAYTEAIKGQSVMTGVRWIDGLGQSVRPILTYWWMALFTVHKVTVIYNSTTYKEFLSNLWTQDDWGILSMIIGFWFVDRALKRMKGIE